MVKQKIIAQQHGPNPFFRMEYLSNSLMYELHNSIIVPLDLQSLNTIQRIAFAIEKEINKDPDREIVEILKKVKSPCVTELLQDLSKKPVVNLRHNLAFKALVLVVRNWPKKNYHVHISDLIDGEFVMKQTGARPVLKYNYRTSRLHNNDDWIQNTDQFIAAYKYVLKQMQEDNNLWAQSRINPYKKFNGKSHKSRLINMHPFLHKLQLTAQDFSEHQYNETGLKPEYKFLASLNRRKYARENPQHFLDIIDQLVDIKQKHKGSQLDDYLYGIDICGGEIMDWEWQNNQRTEYGWKLFEALNRAADSGLQIVTHLGDMKNYNEKYLQDFITNPERIIISMLDYFKSYIENLNCLTRIAHATVLHDRFGVKDYIKERQKAILKIIKDKGIILERCYYDDIRTLKDLQFKTPVYNWKKQSINFVLGIDGFIHDTKGHYDFKTAPDYDAISLSQWLILLMLAAPKNEGWTVNYVRSKTSMK
ncbi:MAG: hypothetical protein PHV30_02635 [Candidatus Margulisbacteria bacterium]|nr:hypothetical protein [Candidatus Margulisiibacteriota bacterium]